MSMSDMNDTHKMAVTPLLGNLEKKNSKLVSDE